MTHNQTLVLTFRYGLMFIILLSLAFGAYQYLSIGSAQTTSLEQFHPSIISFGFWICFELFVTYAVSTWLSITLILVSLIIVYKGLTEKDSQRSTNCFIFAGTVFGFATGIPIGSFSSTKRNSGSGDHEKTH